MSPAPTAVTSTPGEPAPSNRLWPRSTSVLLILVGVVLAVVSFLVVINMPALGWHSARDHELRATYDAFRETGTLLVKAANSGSKYTQAPATGPWVSATWDDDPGAYIVASLMGLVTGSSSPYPGLGLAEALLVALPLLWLPTAVARIFKRPIAGYAVVLLPPAMWLLNNGTFLAGTEYGLSDAASPTPVYALYGIAASIAFLSLSLLVLFCTFRLRTSLLIAVSCGLVVLAAAGDLSRSLSGMGIAAGVGVLWWLHTRKKWRWVAGIVAALTAVALTIGLQSATMTGLNVARAAQTGQSMANLPDTHAVWHSLYLGLSYPEPITGQHSPLGIAWSDEFGWNQARAIDPDVVIASADYDLILRHLYVAQVKAHPLTVAKLYVDKFLFVVREFGGMISFILVGLVLALTRRASPRRTLAAAITVTIPTLLIGLIPPVLVMPLLYYYSELTAVLSVLVAIALGGLVWSLTARPAHVSVSECSRLSDRGLPPGPAAESAVHLSVVVPTHNGSAVIERTLRTLADRLTAQDEIIVVEDGSTDGTGELLHELEARWSAAPELVVLASPPGPGDVLRTGALASRGRRVLLTADDLPFGMTDYDQFTRLPEGVMVAIGSKARGRIPRFLRSALLESRVGDTPGTVWADGEWCRSFAVISRESGSVWMTELVLAADLRGNAVIEVPVVADRSHETPKRRSRARDRWQSVIGFARLAIHNDEYRDENGAVPLGSVRGPAPAVTNS